MASLKNHNLKINICGLKQNDQKKASTVHHIGEEGNQYCQS